MNKYDDQWRAQSAALALEARARMEARAKPPGPDDSVRKAAAQIVDARMLGAEVQPRTFAGRDIDVVEVEHKAIFVGADGRERMEVSKTSTLFDRSACAVFRLARDEMISHSGVLAALCFREAGDRVLGGVRVRTTNFEREPRSSSAPANAADLDEVAVWRWGVARCRLQLPQFRILDGVMRHDESSQAAARAAYPKYDTPANRKRLLGMGDQALIDACGTLAEEYGLEGKKADYRSLGEI